LFDALSVSDELRERATAVVLTTPYHERDARGSVFRCTRRPQTPGRIGSRSSASTRSACAAWRARTSRGCARAGEGYFHCPGAWPFGLHAYAGREENALILWLPSINGIVTGDSLSDFGDGLDIQLARDARRCRPTARVALERVLS
jgi:hypothetical protein